MIDNRTTLRSKADVARAKRLVGTIMGNQLVCPLVGCSGQLVRSQK